MARHYSIEQVIHIIKIVFSILLWIIAFLGLAQPVKGRLSDSETGLPIAYAHIQSGNGKLSTVSNKLGLFELHTNSSLGDSLLITHTSYSPVRLWVSSDSIHDIKMNPDIIILDEVIVMDILGDVIEQVTQELKNSPIEYSRAFYRQITYQDSMPKEWIEAFYNISSTKNGIDKIKIDQARFARKKYDTSGVFVSHTNFSYIILCHKIYESKTEDQILRVGKPFHENFLDNYTFTVSKTFEKSEDSFVIISFKVKDKTVHPINGYGHFTYNLTKKRLIHYLIQVGHSLGMDELSDYYAGKNLSVESPLIKLEFNYHEETGLLKYIRSGYTYNLIKDEEVIPSYVQSTMIFYEESDKVFTKLREPDIKLEDVSNFENAKYKPKFWRDNPVITLTPEEKAMIATFEKENAFGTYFK